LALVARLRHLCLHHQLVLVDLAGRHLLHHLVHPVAMAHLVLEHRVHLGRLLDRLHPVDLVVPLVLVHLGWHLSLVGLAGLRHRDRLVIQAGLVDQVDQRDTVCTVVV
jgi:hypothetical protein